MEPISTRKLSEIFKLVPKPKYVLGTTYTLSLAFFESVVFPYIDRSNLKSCLILCDLLGYQRALMEGAALQGAAQDYMVVPSPLPGCFHPKVWLVIGESQAILLCGSGNLTQAGFMNNAEFFDSLHFTPDAPATSDLQESIRTFVRGLAEMWPESDSHGHLCIETLTQIEDALSGIPVGTIMGPSPRFLHSFSGPLIEQLPEISGAQELYAAAPFFGNSLDGIDLLAKRYVGAKLSIFPAVHSSTATDAPLRRLSQSYKTAKVARLSIPKKAKGAFAHLKLYGLIGSNESWLFCTSANCTQAAWGGMNTEAGIVRPLRREELSRYFVPDNAPLPQETINYENDNLSCNALRIWATDTGSRIEIAIADKCTGYLPLENVTITVRSGTNVAFCQKSSLFEQGRHSYIDWGSFPGWQKRRKMAICLDIEAATQRGEVVRGSCFVENRFLLTADPIHRSAWRGALTLLGEEGAPELADIAAIFTLARDLFNGTLIRMPQSPVTANRETQSSGETLPLPIAVWPPEPDVRELQKRIGAKGLGELQWFQRILQTLLRNEKSDGDVNDTSHDSHGSDIADVSESDQRQADEEKRAISVAERIWRQAERDYDHLYRRLFELVPNSQNAPNIWPAAIFSFLSTMAVYRTAKRLAPGFDFGIDAETLCDEFLRVMLSERKQDDDFCCPKGLRYRHEKFPALADDLRKTFKVQIHFDLTTVMLALIVDQQLRSSKGFGNQFAQNRVLQVCDGGFSADDKTLEAAQRVWKRYLRDEKQKSTDAEFAEIFKGLCKIKIP